MIELIEIFIIAIAQGIGEFLPISSSGHNAVLNHLFERFGEPLTEDSAEFVKLNVLLHVGSLVAVLIVFRQRIIDMLTKDFRLIPMLVVATIPGGTAGLLIKKFAPWIQDDLRIISACFIVTGILLLYTLRLPEREKTTSTMTWLDALIIGCMQAIAILPGISRSGSTIVAGLFCRLKREEAAAFSFILSIPIITAGGLADFKDMLKAESAGTLPSWLLLVGALVSCVAGILALVFLLNWLKKGKLWYFAIWVFVMSPITMVLAFLPMQEKTESEAADVLTVGVDVLTVEMTEHSGTVSVFFSQDGKTFFTESSNGNEKFVRIFDAKSGKELHHFEKCCFIVASPDGKKLVTADDSDYTARIWNIESGEELKKLDRIYSADFSPDGKKLVTSNRDHTVSIVELE